MNKEAGVSPGFFIRLVRYWIRLATYSNVADSFQVADACVALVITSNGSLQ